jgi:hypothetical protein
MSAFSETQLVHKTQPLHTFSFTLDTIVRMKMDVQVKDEKLLKINSLINTVFESENYQ